MISRAFANALLWLACQTFQVLLFSARFSMAQEGAEDAGKEDECHAAQLGDDCFKGVMWAMTQGIYKHPDWYPGLSPGSFFEDFQETLYQNGVNHCEKPCPVALPLGASCNAYGCGSEKPTQACQCDEGCKDRRNCCLDYQDECTAEGSCSNLGCADFKSWRRCQCNSHCEVYGDCCHDYKAICVDHNRTGPSGVTIAPPLIVGGTMQESPLAEPSGSSLEDQGQPITDEHYPSSVCPTDHFGHYSSEQLREIVVRNCQKARHATGELGNNDTACQFTARCNVWSVHAERAQALCDRAVQEVRRHNDRKAAEIAVNAWGEMLTNGSECCVLSSPPYCVDSDIWMKNNTLMFHTPLGILFSLLAFVFMFSGVFGLYKRLRASRSDERAERKQLQKQLRKLQKKANLKGNENLDETGDSSPLPPGGMSSRGERDLKRQLTLAWLENSCLRALPGARECAETTASLFEELCKRFDFQEDSARNQHEHLMSMWRSHCALVADQKMQDGDAFDVRASEEHLLLEALSDLHSDLLPGFRRWRARLRQGEAGPVRDSVACCPDVDEEAGGQELVEGDAEFEQMPELGGADFQVLPPKLCGSDAQAAKLSRQLAEICTYLMVWGEAGNLRFMPECIYFITELVLAANAATGHSIMNDPAACGFKGGGLFL